MSSDENPAVNPSSSTEYRLRWPRRSVAGLHHTSPIWESQGCARTPRGPTSLREPRRVAVAFLSAGVFLAAGGRSSQTWVGQNSSTLRRSGER